MKIYYLNGSRLLRAMLAGSSQKVKVHIHSNEPETVFAMLKITVKRQRKK